nr:immunoglobulin heavy chain junction region [Homo sapiens]MBN4349865.1 immunoglobulin heavy chain junction region [Homo sapiens]MBN4518947.1 immunoglobulin heavy chain junction region [Homo sapiens]MBN4639777.1 immunoglobulin heavy chain junction region [Homo sapiens]
ADSPSPETTPR